MSKYFQRNAQYYIVAFCAIIAYLLIYGYYILNPFYTDWLLGHGDLSQHYLGWQAFQNGSWMFPIGMTNQLAYPSASSIIFTDSIPLFAVFFKLFRAILPTEFQYFGIWGLLCFILQGVIAAHIIQRFVKNKPYVVLTSLLFVFAPVMIWRMYAHTALAGQWLILLAFDLFFSNREDTTLKQYWKWALVGALSASVHIYLLLMCGIILAGGCLENLIRTKKVRASAIMLGMFLIPAVLVVALLGGFTSGMQANNSGLGLYSFNLNGFLNPQGWSQIFNDLPTYSIDQYEGFSYLGAGVIVLAALCAVAIIFSKRVRAKIRSNWTCVISLVAVSGISLLISLSNVITLNNNVILEIPLNKLFFLAWSTFRASGRIAWIMVYLIMLFSVIVTYQFLTRRVAVLLVTFTLCLQIFDIHGQLALRNLAFNHCDVYQSELKDENFWDSLAQRNTVRHMIMTVGFEQIPQNVGWSIANWALDHQITLNDFYFARSNKPLYYENLRAALASPKRTELFVFSSDNLLTASQYDLNFYQADGLIFGTVEPLDGFARVDQHVFSENKYNFGDDCVDNGSDSNGKRCLYRDGFSYGPFWEVPKGNYQVEVSGENLTAASIYACSKYGTLQHEMSDYIAEDDRVVFTTYLDEDSSNFEIYIRNQSDAEVWLYSIQVSRVE